MTAKRTFASQVKAREAASKIDIPKGKVATYRRFKHELSRNEKLALIVEIVETRGVELVRAYKNVVEVSLGQRRRVSRKTGKVGYYPNLAWYLR